MIRPLSMRAQTSAIIVVGFLVSHAAGYLFYSLDRRDALQLTEAVDLAERAAGVSRLVRDLPETWRSDIVRLSDSRAFRVWTSGEPALELADITENELDIATFLRSQVPRIASNEMRVRFIDTPEYPLALPPFDSRNRLGSPDSVSDLPQVAPSIAISIRHSDQEWINFLGQIDTPKSIVPELFLANLVSAVLGIALIAFWLVRRVTAPLARLAEAAENLGRNLVSPPLPLSGPREVAVAASAFNRMQRRLSKLVSGRTELLAAISHDLRTPLTQIRLRLETLSADPLREKNLRTLDEMNEIIGTFLAFAHATHEGEPRSRVDLGALVSSICDDLSDSGAAVECNCAQRVIVSCKRVAVKRAVTNLIENALKYGNEARVSLSCVAGQAVINVCDSGPGIPENEIEAVLQAFYRGSSPQSSSIGGGTGLGLSIAQAIAEDHGGEVRLVNLPDGGLLSEIFLPV